MGSGVGLSPTNFELNHDVDLSLPIRTYGTLPICFGLGWRSKWDRICYSRCKKESTSTGYLASWALTWNLCIAKQVNLWTSTIVWQLFATPHNAPIIHHALCISKLRIVCCGWRQLSYIIDTSELLHECHLHTQLTQSTTSHILLTRPSHSTQLCQKSVTMMY